MKTQPVSVSSKRGVSWENVPDWHLSGTKSLVIFACILCSAFVQTAVADAAKISDSFGKAAIFALKSIEADRSQVGGRDARKAIDAADAEASSKEETAIVDALNHLDTEHVINNVAASVDGNVDEIRERENACFKPFEENLRARSSEIPKSCDPASKIRSPKH
ncbi:MAG TPA: hypothetical protein VH022_14295 [Candidatus Acidoferrum sp.]|jgi:hypothetical protein|nr:hypothetical protein [Candidatus Acidoferrum sp.]